MPATTTDLQLGLQAWTFRHLTLCETITQTQKLGIPFLQAYPNQKLGGDFPETATLHHAMPREHREKILARCRAQNVTLASYGVVKPATETEWRELFDFAQAMQLRDLAIEPPHETWPAVLPLVAQLSRETSIRAGIHNHANPVTASEFLRRLAPYPAIQIYGDNGHWARSNFAPADMLRAYAGHLLALHFKDIAQFSPDARDVPLGTGVTDLPAQLAELRRQKFRGILYLEYEHNSPQLPDDLARCVQWFRQAAA